MFCPINCLCVYIFSVFRLVLSLYGIRHFRWIIFVYFADEISFQGKCVCVQCHWWFFPTSPINSVAIFRRFFEHSTNSCVINCERWAILAFRRIRSPKLCIDRYTRQKITDVDFKNDNHVNLFVSVQSRWYILLSRPVNFDFYCPFDCRLLLCIHN